MVLKARNRNNTHQSCAIGLWERIPANMLMNHSIICDSQRTDAEAWIPAQHYLGASHTESNCLTGRAKASVEHAAECNNHLQNASSLTDGIVVEENGGRAWSVIRQDSEPNNEKLSGYKAWVI